MIQINPNAKTLNIILPNTNRALQKVIENVSSKELQTLSLGKDLNTIIKDLFEQSKENQKADKLLLELAKKNPTLKELGSITSSVKELIQVLTKESTLLALKKQLTTFLSDIKDISPKNLQEKVLNSGLFLENKLKTIQASQVEIIIKESLSNDFKVILLKAIESVQNSTLANKQEILKHLDKTLLTIDYQQLVSHLSNATSLFIPYSWDALEDGEISMKSTKDGKFFTDIELQLKVFGSLKLRLGMFEKNQLSININAENKTLKQILQENIPILKKQLIDVGIILMSIHFIDESHSTAYEEIIQSIDAGFEVTV